MAGKGFTTWPLGHKRRNCLKMSLTNPQTTRFNFSGPVPLGVATHPSTVPVSNFFLGRSIYSLCWYAKPVSNDTVMRSPASFSRPIPTPEMIERRNQILRMEYGERSVRFLLEEGKLRKCGLLGKDESTDDWLFAKYSRWQQVPLPRKVRRTRLISPARASNRSLPEDAGIKNRFTGNSSSQPHINPATRRPKQRPRSRVIKYSTDESVEMSIDQYGSNDLVDFSHIMTNIGSRLPLLSIPEYGHTCRANSHFSPIGSSFFIHYDWVLIFSFLKQVLTSCFHIFSRRNASP